MKHWEIKSQQPAVGSQQAANRTDWVIRQLLKNRGIDLPEKTEEFLNPQLSTTNYQLSKLLDETELRKATQRTKDAIHKGQPIIIHGDYDVDGICGTAILWETIYYNLGYKNVRPFIPHRTTHGYGVSRESIDEINHANPPAGGHAARQRKTGLIITTDCGINAAAETEYAKRLGFDVIITDHHTKKGKAPAAAAILHTYDLTGAGVAWILAKELISKLEIRELGTRINSLELVALATVADLQPLLGVNRTLVKLGLEELNRTSRVGLKTLFQMAGIEGKAIRPYEVGWVIAPRLNAMGRLEHALDSLRLLCTSTPSQAQTLASKLNQANQKRQQMTKAALGQARQILAAKQGSIEKSLILDHNEWHEGIIGLVAAKITDEFYRPTIAISRGEKISKGSARSIKGFNIIEAIQKCENLLIDVGGHAMAAGFSIETPLIEEFKNKFLLESESILIPELLTPTLPIDLELNPLDISWEFLQTLKDLEPHGIGNPKPVFMSKNLTVARLKNVGQKNQHLKITTSNQQPASTNFDGEISRTAGGSTINNLSAIGFNLGHWADQLGIGSRIDVVYTLEEDTWNGNQAMQLKLKDLRHS